jgi:hypothetical protein
MTELPKADLVTSRTIVGLRSGIDVPAMPTTELPHESGCEAVG